MVKMAIIYKDNITELYNVVNIILRNNGFYVEFLEGYNGNAVIL